MRIDFSTLPLWVNKNFYPGWFDRRRFHVEIGGAGSGKSVDAFRKKVFRMVSEPGHNYLVVRKSSKSNSTSTIPLTHMCISDWNLWPLFKENKSNNNTITCLHNGNQVKYMGLDDVEKIKSITFDNGPLTDVIIEEATEITEKDFNQLNLRLRGITRQPFQITLLFNPVSDTHWMKNRFFDNPGPKKKEIRIHHSTYHDNRFLDKDYKGELEALKFEDRVYYDIYALGKWGSIGNLVFRNIKYETCPYKYEDFDEVLAGMDFGYNHYHSNQLIGLKDGVKYSFRELYVRHMTNDDIIIENEKRKILSTDQACTADSAEPKSIKDWENAGYNITGAKKGKDSVMGQISWLNRGEWHIDPELCPGLASETKSFKWKEDRDGNPLDEPVKFKDDAIAACLTGDSIVNTAAGDFPIKDLIGKTGQIKTWDGKTETQEKFFDVSLTRTAQEVFIIRLKDGGEIRATKEHPLLTDHGWKTVSEIEGKYKIVKIDPYFNNKMEYISFSEIVKQDHLEDVFNMEVENTHCFSVNGGYIVHNCRYAIEEKTEYETSILDVL